ncbi:MAG: V-type ATP synthase subunit E [Candidatus Omnitrophota bacterium]
MEMDLQNIIDKLKQEGVGEAEKKAEDIIHQAEKKALSIAEEAKGREEEIIRKAEQEAERLRKNGEEAVRQASRDVLLSLREQITGLFDRIVRQEVAGQMSPAVLKEMIVKLASKFEKDETLDVEILLSEKDKKDLEKTLFAALKGEMKKGITLKASPKVEHGFLIGIKGKSSYYDFTDEAIAEAFMAHLNPKITEILTSGK